MDQLCNSELTEEEAQTQLEALGVELPERPEDFGGRHAGHHGEMGSGFEEQQDEPAEAPAEENSVQETSTNAL